MPPPSKLGIILALAVDSVYKEVVATLYDSNRKELGTNKHHKNFVHVIQHKCEKTGIYYITFTFEDEEEYCGAAVLGFAKHEAEK